jgi:ABC-2 type transport system permease protein
MTGATAGRTGRTKPVPVPPGGPPAALDHRAPHLGGFSLSVLRIEIRRLLRNRRTITFALIAPVIFFLVFGLNKGYMEQSAGQGNVSAVVMISMALYGAVLATASGGAMVSIERASGWSRQPPSGCSSATCCPQKT